ncbi:MAG: manganese efflux pump MntP family protein [Lachnospiraceae bacterium]
MDWWEVLLITIGISLDIFAATECEGALTARVEKKSLFLITLAIGATQVGALFIGAFLAGMVYPSKSTDKRLVLVLVELILFAVGVRMIRKAIKNERIMEHRVERVELKRMFHMIAMTSVNTICIGAAFAFMGTDLLLILSMIAAVTVAVVILGTYTGYHFGYEQKSKAYAIGGGILLAAGVDVVIKQILM